MSSLTPSPNPGCWWMKIGRHILSCLIFFVADNLPKSPFGMGVKRKSYFHVYNFKRARHVYNYNFKRADAARHVRPFSPSKKKPLLGHASPCNNLVMFYRLGLIPKVRSAWHALVLNWGNYQGAKYFTLLPTIFTWLEGFVVLQSLLLHNCLLYLWCFPKLRLFY